MTTSQREPWITMGELIALREHMELRIDFAGQPDHQTVTVREYERNPVTGEWTFKQQYEARHTPHGGKEGR